ncbi:MAG: ATP-binding protein [Nannocystaceae bacterium]
MDVLGADPGAGALSAPSKPVGWILVSLALVLGVVFWLIESQHANEEIELNLELAQASVSVLETRLALEGPIEVRGDQVYAGSFLVNDSTEVVDHVERGTGLGSTIFHRDVRISTTARAANETDRAVGTRANAEVRELVYERGETFRGVTTTIGKNWVIVYVPLQARDGTRIGMLATFRELDQFEVDLWRFRLVLGATLGSLFFLLTGLLLLREHHAKMLEQQARVIAFANLELANRAQALARAEEDAHAARNEAERANTAKTKFLSTMSHELRTPLNAILGYSELALEELEPGDSPTSGDRLLAQQDVARIHKSGTHLLALINDLLDLSKIEADRMELVLTAVSVQTVCSELAHTARPLAAARHNRLEIEIDPDVGEMYSDARKVQQILLNLLGNACKFTENGVIGLRVHRELQNGKPWVVFEVEDSGIGVPADQLPRLFEPFIQVGAASRRKYGGTGLGLAITRELSRLLGGGIEVESTLGVGTTFTVRLPEVTSAKTSA